MPTLLERIPFWKCISTVLRNEDSCDVHNGCVPLSLVGKNSFGEVKTHLTSQLAKMRFSLKLHQVIRLGNTAKLEEILSLLQYDMNYLDEADSSGKKPIHIAAEVDNVEAVKILQRYSANIYSKDESFYQLQPAHTAAAFGSLKVLKYLLQDEQRRSRCLLAVDSEGSTPLHWAVRNYQKECIKHLLESGATCCLKQSQGTNSTVLHLAASHGLSDVIQVISQLRPGVEFQSALKQTDSVGYLPLHTAIAANNPQIIHHLIENGANVDALTNAGANVCHIAVSKSAWNSLVILLDYGADPFSCDLVKGRSVLHTAALNDSNLAQCQKFIDMIKTNQKLSSILNHFDQNGFTALHYAADRGFTGVVKTLLSLGAAVEVRCKKGRTALHRASKRGHLNIVQALLEKTDGLSVLNNSDIKGQTALHLAACRGHEETVQLLISSGALSYRDYQGHNALHLAASNNHHQLMQELIQNYPNTLNECDSNGRTPLHLAALENSAHAVQVLLTNNALHEPDNGGRTALELAILHKRKDAATVFVNRENWKDYVIQPSCDYGNIVLGLIQDLPEVMHDCLDRSVVYHRLKDSRESFIDYDFDVLQPHFEEEITAQIGCTTIRRSPMLTLKAMSAKKRSGLLTHPLCTTFLQQKWIIYGLYCSALILLGNLAYVTLLSYLVIAAVEALLAPCLRNITYMNVMKHRPNMSERNDFKQLFLDIEADKAIMYSVPVEAIAGFAVALAVMLLKEIIDFASERRRYFRDWTNYVELVVFVSGTAFIGCLSCDVYHQKVGPLTFPIGACAIFLAYFNLMRFFRPFGTFGIYSFMFFTIFKTLVQVSLFFFTLTLAFTGSFYILFHSFVFPDNERYYILHEELHLNELWTNHNHLFASGMRIASLMLGDLEASERFIQPWLENMVPFPWTTYFFYTLLLILMPILLSSLLMGLALGDLAQVRQNAVILRLQMQVSLHESLERLFPRSWIEHFRWKTNTYRLYPGRRVDFITYLAQFVSGGSTPQVMAESAADYQELNKVLGDGTAEIVQLKRKLNEVQNEINEQRELQRHILFSLAEILQHIKK